MGDYRFLCKSVVKFNLLGPVSWRKRRRQVYGGSLGVSAAKRAYTLSAKTKSQGEL